MTQAVALRRDALENHRALLTAAAQVFADHGLEASVDQVAKAAGVGIGTLYRHFPNKDALIEALVVDVLETMCRLADEAATRTDGSGLEYFLEEACVCKAAHVGCLARLWSTDTSDASIRRVRRTIDQLLDQAKQSGRVREDLTSTDITIAMWSLRGVIETTKGIAPTAWQRHLEVLIAGMRPGSEPLKHRPVSRAQIDRILAVRAIS